jgi:hypothetical protein
MRELATLKNTVHSFSKVRTVDSTRIVDFRLHFDLWEEIDGSLPQTQIICATRPDSVGETGGHGTTSRGNKAMRQKKWSRGPTCSRASGHFFLGWLPVNGEPIRLNRAFHTMCSILRFVVSSAAEAELGALFLNCQEGMIFRLTLDDLGHPQPKTPVHCDNATAIGRGSINYFGQK